MNENRYRRMIEKREQERQEREYREEFAELVSIFHCQEYSLYDKPDNLGELGFSVLRLA